MIRIRIRWDKKFLVRWIVTLCLSRLDGRPQWEEEKEASLRLPEKKTLENGIYKVTAKHCQHEQLSIYCILHIAVTEVSLGKRGKLPSPHIYKGCKFIIMVIVIITISTIIIIIMVISTIIIIHTSSTRPRSRVMESRGTSEEENRYFQRKHKHIWFLSNSLQASGLCYMFASLSVLSSTCCESLWKEAAILWTLWMWRTTSGNIDRDLWPWWGPSLWFLETGKSRLFIVSKVWWWRCSVFETWRWCRDTGSEDRWWQDDVGERDFFVKNSLKKSTIMMINE